MESKGVHVPGADGLEWEGERPARMDGGMEEGGPHGDPSKTQGSWREGQGRQEEVGERRRWKGEILEEVVWGDLQFPKEDLVI